MNKNLLPTGAKLVGKNHYPPMVSVIMPIRNECQYINESIQAVIDQDYPSEAMEILVVDGLSTDGTREIVRSFQNDHPNIRLIDNPAKIVPTGLNIAISQASGEIIVRVDGHCVIAKDYVRLCVRSLQNEEDVVGVGGPMETIGETTVSQAIAEAMSTPFGVGGSSFRTVKNRKLFVETVAFPAYWSSTLKTAGPFDEELVRNQDDEYNYRLRAMGGKILLSPDIHSLYYSRGSLRKLWRQYYQYGFWKVRVMQKHPMQMRWSQFVPSVFVAGIFIAAVIALLFPLLGKYVLEAGVGLYGFANIAASIWTAARSKWTYLLILPATFAILHVSYGLGFWIGLIKFVNKWGLLAHQPTGSGAD
jgi:succinoglycan biosynthesis protein ExoA